MSLHLGITACICNSNKGLHKIPLILLHICSGKLVCINVTGIIDKNGILRHGHAHYFGYFDAVSLV